MSLASCSAPEKSLFSCGFSHVDKLSCPRPATVGKALGAHDVLEAQTRLVLAELCLRTVIEIIERMPDCLDVVLGIGRVVEANHAAFAVVENPIGNEDRADALATAPFGHDNRNDDGNDDNPPNDGDGKIDRIRERKAKCVPKPQEHERQDGENRDGYDIAFAHKAPLSLNHALYVHVS